MSQRAASTINSDTFPLIEGTTTSVKSSMKKQAAGWMIEELFIIYQ